MAAEGGKRGGNAGGGGAGPGAGGPPGENRFGREHSPGFGPAFENPYMRGRDLPPPGRDLPPPPLPRDPFFDDPYRHPLLPDPYFDRLREDPYRPDPYGPPPFPDRYRDPYGRAPVDSAVQRRVTVDCEIIIMSPEMRPYADMVERRLKNINLFTNVVVIREDFSIQQQVEDTARRSCLFAIVINNQNEIHRSLTLNILHGVAQEHRNMPLDDALSLVARSFEKYLQAEKEKLTSGSAAGEKIASAAGSFVPPSKDVAYLLNLLADSRQVTLEELDKVMAYLQERKDALSATAGPISAATAAAQLQQQQLQQQQQQLQAQQLQQQLQLQQQQQQHKEYETKILSMMNGSTAPAAQTTVSPVLPSSLAITRQPVNPVLGVGALTGPPSVGAVKAPAGPSATLINFDNPTVQKALDNLIQSGPSLLKNISQPSLYPSTSTAPPRPPY